MLPRFWIEYNRDPIVYMWSESKAEFQELGPRVFGTAEDASNRSNVSILRGQMFNNLPMANTDAALARSHSPV